MHTTVFQAEIIAINEACKKCIDTKQNNMQYIKIFSDSQAAILALNSNTVTSSLVKQTINTLNLLAGSTERLEICWIKAHVGYKGNERADQLAREAVKNSQVGVNTPQSWACYKAQLKYEIYKEWERRWKNDNAYRMTKIFYPKPDSNKAKTILKLNRGKPKDTNRINNRAK